MQAFGRRFDPDIVRVYVATLTVGVAYGISIALTPLLLKREGYGEQAIGVLAAVFASGIVALSLPMGAIMKKVGAKAVVTGALLVYAVSVGVFPYARGMPEIAAVRVFDGASSVAVWIGCETVLLARSEPKHKAFMMSLYAIAVAIGYVVGPLAATGFTRVMSFEHTFLVASALAVVAAAYVAFRFSPQAAVPISADATGHHDAGKAGSTSGASQLEVFSRIKTSAVATFAYGYFQSSVVLFLPIYLIKDRGIPEGDTIRVTAFFAAGMLLFSNFFGSVGDRVGHLRVMRVLAVVGATAIASFAWLPSFGWMCGAVFVAGATLASISPVSLALQGIVTDDRDLSRANALYNACYALGMLTGPPISSVVFHHFGGPFMLGHLASLWGVFVVFAWVFRADDPSYRGDKAAAVAKEA